MFTPVPGKNPKNSRSPCGTSASPTATRSSASAHGCSVRYSAPNSGMIKATSMPVRSLFNKIAGDQARARRGRTNHVGRDRRDRIEPRLAKFALHVEFFRKAETAMGLHAHVCGGPGGVRGQQLRHVGFGGAVAPG